MPRQPKRRRKIHVQIEIVKIDEEQVPFERVEQFAQNMAAIYEETAEWDGESFHIRTYDEGGPFKIMSDMGDFFNHFGPKFNEIAQQLAGEAKDEMQKGFVFCARIFSPSLKGPAPVLERLNAAFSRFNVGVYFESFQGGVAIYARDSRGFDIIYRRFSPEYVQFKAENKALLETRPSKYLSEALRFLGV